MNNLNFATNEELTEKLDKIFVTLPQDKQHALIKISSSLYINSEEELNQSLKKLSKIISKYLFLHVKIGQ